MKTAHFRPVFAKRCPKVVPGGAGCDLLGTSIANLSGMSSINKAIHHSPVILKLAAVIARVRASFHFEVPTGYQDENGFHYGNQPRRTEMTWPPSE